MNKIPAVFQKAVEAANSADQERKYWDRQHRQELADQLIRTLKGWGLEIPPGRLMIEPTITIEGIEFFGRESDGFEVLAKCWTSEDGLIYCTIGSLERLGEVIREHYQVLAEIEERAAAKEAQP